MWRDIGGAPVGEMPSGSSFECLVALADGRVTLGTYREGFLRDWRWVDPKGKKIEPQRYMDLPQS